MDAQGWKSSQDQSEVYPEDSVRASYRLIARICRSSGLSPADSDDLAQDLWEWLIRTGVPMDLIATPWLRATVHNYVLRFRRRSYHHCAREGKSLDIAPEPQSSPPLPVLESNQLLDRVASVLPRTERCLLALIRRGHSMAEAARILGIPRGSRAYYKERLIACARQEIQRRSVFFRQGNGEPEPPKLGQETSDASGVSPERRPTRCRASRPPYAVASG